MPTRREAWVANLGRYSCSEILSNLYVFSTDFPAAMSWLSTSTNSWSPSPRAPSFARSRSCVRRASDSMMRSSTASCAIASAVDWVIEESNEATLDATLTVGYGGNVQTRADAE